MGTYPVSNPGTLAWLRRFHLHERAGQNSHLLREHRLTQQFFADVYTHVMQARLDWMRFNRNTWGHNPIRGPSL